VEFSRSIILALVVSGVVHGLLVIGLIVYLAYAPASNVEVMLDLSSVEVSCPEKVDETAAVTPLPSSPPPEPVRPKSAEKPQEQKVEKLQAPDPLAPKFPEPKEEPPQMQEPVVRETSPEPDPHKELKESNNSNDQAIPAAAAPRQARIDAPPSPKRAIRPDYPKGARQRGEQGAVVLEIQVDAEGAVSEAKVVVSSGFAELDEAAVKAARMAKFRPAKSGNEFVASTARLKLDFKLK